MAGDVAVGEVMVVVAIARFVAVAAEGETDQP